jgi:RNA polymerase sigma-70 factor (ECF subfamily)
MDANPMPEELTSQAEPTDDRELLSRVARQERPAFEVLYRRHYRRMFNFVMRVVRREEVAEEVVDDAMFVLWTHAATFEGGSSVSTWMLGIAYRQALKALERDRKHSRVDADDEALSQVLDPDPAIDPQMAALIRDDNARLQEAIGALSEHHRVVVELTAMGHSYGEISEVIGCPENTVKTRMFHARQQLKRLLDNAVNAYQSGTGTKRSWTNSIHQS